MTKKKKAGTAAAPPTTASGVASVAVAGGLVLPELGVGDLVEIFGLQGAKELNGRQGRIVKFIEDTQRFGVRLTGDDETKAVKPSNLKRLQQAEVPISQKATLEKELAKVVQQLKQVEDGGGGEERGSLQRELAVLIQKLKRIEEAEQEKARAAAAEAKAASEKAAAAAAAAPPETRQRAQGPAPPLPLQPPPPPREQHHPLPQRRKESDAQASNASSGRSGASGGSSAAAPSKAAAAAAAAAAASASAGAGRASAGADRGLHGAIAAAMQRREPPQPRPQPPPVLPERLKDVVPNGPVEYADENEYPDPTLAQRSARVAAGALVCGIVASQAELCPPTWFVWSFLTVHLVGVAFLTDYTNEHGLVGLCATFGLHIGVALSESVLWLLDRDGPDSVGPWSLLVLFTCVLYLHSFWTECLTLPPDYITSISLFFPMFPAFNAAVVLSCVELFLEWRYFPELKIWKSAAVAGTVLMAAGQALIFSSCRTAGRNFWASCRNMPEEEEKPEDFVGLEVPDRRIVQEGAFKWERHPSYLGAMLWGVGIEVALCNPIMLVIVSFVLWASLLYVALEEEQELYDEFKGGYANYSALTNCWIPLFNSFLENAAFNREMTDNAEEAAEDFDEDVDEEDEEDGEDDCPSEDDMLPTWEGVPRGGALWNRQFREPWLLG